METVKEAEDGDAAAMQPIADWYEKGKNCLPQNEELSSEWLVRNGKKRGEGGDAQE